MSRGVVPPFRWRTTVGLMAVACALAVGVVMSPAGSAAGGLRVRAISAGGNHTCAIVPSGEAYCFGSDDEGQLGDGAALRDRRTPVRVTGSVDARSVAITSGEHHACALLRGGSAACWGEARFGRLGEGTRAHVTYPTPRAVSLDGRKLVEISAGTYHTCGLLRNGTVLCWGRDNVGQLGNDAALVNAARPVRVALPVGRKATAVSAGGSHTCAVLDDGAASCWGWAFYGRLGDGTSSGMQPIPVRVELPAGRRAVSITAGGFHSCAVLDDGSAACWGSDDEGQLGDDLEFAERPTPAPVALPFGRRAVAISAGDHHTCALLDDGSAACWGSDADERLGTGPGSRLERPIPSLLEAPRGRSFTAISAGMENTCAIATDGYAFCWGSDSDGQLGDDGRIRDRPTPTRVRAPRGP